MENAYLKEEESFEKQVDEVHDIKVPKNANVITSQVLYKVKELDDGSKIVKARIAPHGSKDKEKDGLTSSSAVCPLIGIRVLLSLATIFQFYLVKVDIKTPFLQAGEALRSV